MLNALTLPPNDPTPIFELFRGNFATELLTAAVVHFRVFAQLASGSLPTEELCGRLGLEDRPAVVLFTALRAMGLLEGKDGLLDLTALARAHLLPGGYFEVSDYIGLAAESPGVREMVQRLRSNRPAGVEQKEGAAFIYREGIESAMEQQAQARHLTLALAGRARNVAPYLAARVDLRSARCLLDVAGGSGIYSITCLQQNPQLRAVIWDRPEVLKVAHEQATAYGVIHRLEFIAGDMFADPVPDGADVVLLSNVLHDWDVPQCQALLQRLSAALPSGGRLLIHDVFLSDTLDGPLPVALYSAALFCLTEGRAYSAAEYRSWLISVGLCPGSLIPTLIHCGVLSAVKP